MQQPKNISSHGPTAVRDRAIYDLKDVCEVFLKVQQVLFPPNFNLLDFSKLGSLFIKE